MRVCESDISEAIKTDLKNAKKYAEGAGIRVELKDTFVVADIQKLLQFKIAN